MNWFYIVVLLIVFVLFSKQNKTAQFAFQLNNKVKTIPSVVVETESRNEVYSSEYGNGDAETSYQVEQQQIFQQSQKPWYVLYFDDDILTLSLR